MIINNLRMGWQSIKSAKLRNFFTMLGVIIGVASVLVVVSIGEGVRSQVQKQVDVYGKDLILVQPGKTVARDSEGAISTTNLFANSTRSVLDDDDYRAVAATSGVDAVAPLSVISGTIAYDQKTSDDMLVVATTPEYASILKQKVAFGKFFTEQDGDGNFVVIGRHVAESFFN